MGEITELRVLFWTPYSPCTRLVSCITQTPFGHVAVSVCGLVYDGTLRRPTGWYSEEALPIPPVEEISIPCRLDRDVLAQLLPPNKKYPLLSTMSAWALGYPQYPLSCVGAAKRALLYAGIPVRGRTPYGIWRELHTRTLGVEDITD
jgi:hypothetical protein